MNEWNTHTIYTHKIQSVLWWTRLRTQYSLSSCSAASLFSLAHVCPSVKFLWKKCQSHPSCPCVHVSSIGSKLVSSAWTFPLVVHLFLYVCYQTHFSLHSLQPPPASRSLCLLLLCSFFVVSPHAVLWQIYLLGKCLFFRFRYFFLHSDCQHVVVFPICNAAIRERVKQKQESLATALFGLCLLLLCWCRCVWCLRSWSVSLVVLRSPLTLSIK